VLETYKVGFIRSAQIFPQKEAANQKALQTVTNRLLPRQIAILQGRAKRSEGPQNGFEKIMSSLLYR